MSQITSPIILDTTGRDIVDAIESLSNRANDIENFTSSDVADGSATAWTSVTPLASGEVHSSIFAKISQMFKNIRYLYKMLGTTNISSIGGGTVTGAISALNSKTTFQKIELPVNSAYMTAGKLILYYSASVFYLIAYDAKFSSDADKKTIADIGSYIKGNWGIGYIYMPLTKLQASNIIGALRIGQEGAIIYYGNDIYSYHEGIVSFIL